MSFERPVEPERTLRRWVADHLVFVARTLRSAGTPPAEVDDAVQRTFIIAARRQDDIRAGSERSFLLQIALNVAAHVRRSLARRREVPDSDVPEPIDAATPEQLVQRKDQQQVLQQTLDRMTPDLRTVLVMFEIEERTMAEIAERLKIPPGTVASRLRRAREQFRERLRDVSGRRVAAVAVGVGGVTLASGARATPASWFGQLGPMKGALVWLSALAAVAVPVAYFRHPGRSATMTEARSGATRPEAPRAEARPAEPAPAQAEAATAAPQPPSSAVAPLPKRSLAAVSAPRASASAEELHSELAQLDAARSRLSAGQPEQALALLDAYDRSRTRGALKLEAEVVRIDALSRSGRLAQAEARARAFLKRYPESVLAARVRRIVGR